MPKPRSVDCTVCTDATYTPIICHKCSYTACRNCTKKYILSQRVVDSKCMACKTIWSLDFVFENTDKEFYEKTYKTHRAKIMFEREQSLLPETQHLVEEELKAREDSKKYSDLLKMKKLKFEIFKMKRNKIKEKLTDPELSSKEKKELKIEAKTLLESERRKTKRIQAIKDVLKKARVDIRRQRYPGNVQGEVPKVKPKPVFTSRCPVENCNGYITKKDDPELEGKSIYSCGICNTNVCKKCLEPKEYEHKCDPNTLETVKALKKETRNCPKCQTLIYKISGCDQMYCTQCHTPFSWNTGEVETGRIHNPHYYEYQRQTHGTVPREVGDIPRGGCVEPQIRDISRHVRNLGINPDIFEDIHMLVGHIRGYICGYVFRINAPVDMNLDLRLKYLKNEITRDKFIHYLKMRDKKSEKNQVVNMVMTMFSNTADVLLGNLLECKEPEQVVKISSELESLRKYTNNVLGKAYSRFKNKMPIIDTDFRLDRTYMIGIVPRNAPMPVLNGADDLNRLINMNF